MNMTNCTNPSTTSSVFEKIAKAGSVAPTTLNGLPGMSSLEIAEITGKRHDHILRDIRKMLGELEILDAPRFGEVKFVEAQYRDAKSESRPLTILDKELTFTLLSRYSFKLSNLIVKRWLELEGSDFERVSVQEAAVYLVEREKDNRQAAFKFMDRNRQPRKLTAQEQETQKLIRQAAYADNKAHKNGEWKRFC